MSTEARVSALEQAMAELARAQTRTQEALRVFSEEMRAFKDEMRTFKDETRALAERSEQRWGQRWGELANKTGTLVEDIVAPGIPEVFRNVFGYSEEPECAIRVRRRHRTDKGRMQEFDVLAFGGDVVLVNETRSRLSPQDIADFVAVLREARAFLPEAEGRKVVGSLASFYVDPSLVRGAEREGLLLLGLQRGLLAVLNAPGFRPAEF